MYTRKPSLLSPFMEIGKKIKPNNNHYGLGDIVISTMGYINF